MDRPAISLTDDAVLPLLEPGCHDWQAHLATRLHGGVADEGLRRRFTPELNIALVLDAGERPRPVTAAMARAMGYREAQLFDRAFSNLHRRSPRPLAEVADGVYVGAWGDGFAAARLLLPTLLDGLTLDGDPVAFIPNRSTLVVTGSNDTGGLLKAAVRVRRALEDGASERVTTLPLRRTAYGFEAWLPEAQSPAHPVLEQLVHEELSLELEEGSAVLSELLPRCAQPTIGTRPSADGRRREVVVVLSEADGSEVLVPRADEVVTPQGKELRWDEFEKENAAALHAVEGASGWYRLGRS